MSQKNQPMEEVKKQYVCMALESGNMAFIARKVGVSSSTLHKWVRRYRDEIEEEMQRENETTLSVPSSSHDL
ncbi:transposase [Halobacillus amylolyticus]|uniref:Transposase n=1 Tax=Halobacillus amylolyticus TaxID=2932259 RepID=A0ABY4H882_9BACI|nr:transposase [Halobacillus amylolyticus]UOR11002.1 transposase [Halobacillus amylolyticus]